MLILELFRRRRLARRTRRRVEEAFALRAPPRNRGVARHAAHDVRITVHESSAYRYMITCSSSSVICDGRTSTAARRRVEEAFVLRAPPRDRGVVQYGM